MAAIATDRGLSAIRVAQVVHASEQYRTNLVLDANCKDKHFLPQIILQASSEAYLTLSQRIE